METPLLILLILAVVIVTAFLVFWAVLEALGIHTTKRSHRVGLLLLMALQLPLTILFWNSSMNSSLAHIETLGKASSRIASLELKIESLEGKNRGH